MEGCMTCEHSYIIGEWADCRGCKIEDMTKNLPLKLLGDKGKCPYFSEIGINNGWGAK